MQTDTVAEFDAYDQIYNETVDRSLAFSGLTVDFFTRVKVDYFVEVLGSLALPAVSADVIDVGCGVANSHAFLAGRVGQLVGVDVSKACLVKAAARNPNNEYKFYDGINLPYADASFDAASAVCVFHHVSPAARVRLACDIRRVIRPGGLFAIFEHNPLNPLTMHVVNNCEFDKDARLLRAPEAEMLLEAAGFAQISTRYILAVPAGGPLLHRIDRLLARWPVGAQYYTVGRT